MPFPHWFDSKAPDSSMCVVPVILARQATERPDATCAAFADGTVWTYAEAWDAAQRAAAGLADLGVGAGDRVLMMLPNGPAFLRAWFGASALGAAIVPINVALRGETLRHAIDTADATVMICHAELAEYLGELTTQRLGTVVITGAGPLPALPYKVVPETQLQGSTSGEIASPQPWDIGVVLFTSGTTGRSKGVLCPNGHIGTAGAVSHGYLRPGDRIYIYTPMFHTLALGAALATIANGAAMYLAPSFNAQTFWRDVEAAGCTHLVALLSSVTSYLAATIEPGTSAPFEFSMMSPMTADTAAFARRHGFSYFSAFSMTEVSVPVLSTVNSDAFGSCGQLRDGIEARIVDAHDNAVPDGATGELILRAEFPWTLNAGYLNNAEATVKAWRNGWFHTGDVFRRDAEGRFYFVDRIKDAIRRRGENISSQELESEIAAFPGVLECAVIGVPSPYGEQDVMAVVAPIEGVTLSPVELTEFLAGRCAHFQVPRYLRFMAQLPKTGTNKVTKEELRRDGITADTWDREVHGIRLRAKVLAH